MLWGHNCILIWLECVHKNHEMPQMLLDYWVQLLRPCPFTSLEMKLWADTNKSLIAATWMSPENIISLSRSCNELPGQASQNQVVQCIGRRKVLGMQTWPDIEVCYLFKVCCSMTDLTSIYLKSLQKSQAEYVNGWSGALKPCLIRESSTVLCGRSWGWSVGAAHSCCCPGHAACPGTADW